MPQETNLNVSPYFDDFDKDKNFYRVLFKPGSPVQARELSTLQSILQNQIEQFGTHFFKEGSKVIPGQLTYDNGYTCIQVEERFLGIPVSLYTDQLVGLRITGARSGVTATIKKILSKVDSDRGNLTFYVNYEKSGDDFTTELFSDGESLSANKDIVYGASVIAANEPFANTLAFGANATGSAMSIGEGVYFIRGTFAQVKGETLVLDQYSEFPSYRIGFDVQENFISADEDPSLNDNASGFTNFAAPGADRLQVNISLAKKDLDDINDQNFIEIARVSQGQLQEFVTETQYNLFNDTLAKRTYDESGDYYVKPFEVFVKESLNDSIGNKGVYTSEQETNEGNIPSDDLLTIQVSPGKAYIKGYKVERISSSFIDVPKPRTTKTIEEEAVTYETGSPIFVNNISGSPSLGIGTTATVSLLDKRKGGSGSEIGLARLYDFKAQSASFVNETTQFETRLFDIKTFTNVKVATAITSISIGDHIQGGRSGATGFVRTAGTNVSDLSLIDVNGEFIKDESILLNGVQDGRVITKVDNFTFNDVKSLQSAVGVSTFSSDIVLDRVVRLGNLTAGNFRLSNTSGNTGIITASAQNFAGIITSNNIVSYTVPGETVPRFNRITGVSTNGTEINVVGVTSVVGVCNGGVSDGLIPGSIDVNDLVIRSPLFAVGDNTLTTPVSRQNLESLDVTNTTIQLRKQYSDITVANNKFTSPDAGANLFFQPFDEERYFISYNDGLVEPLKESQVEIAADKKTVTFVGLSSVSGKANLFATVLKSKVKTKQKKLNESNTIVINRSSSSASGIGTNTINDGLTQSDVFGTRVQDKKISLNVPDAVELLAVIESNDNQDPSLPTVVLTTYDGPSGNNSDLIVGEKITGLASNAVGLVVEKPNVTTLGIVLLNQNSFNVGEKIKTEKSGITALVSATTEGDRNITNQYSLNTNIKPTFYDFSFIQRKKNFEAPTNRLKIIFKNFFITSDDVGDFFTASSYPSGSEKLIPYDQSSQSFLSDLIDIRPRVAAYNTSSSISPFAFQSRTFASQENNVPDPLVPDENLIVSYDYYQPRRDKLFVNKSGEFEYLEGVPSDDPKEPQSVGDAIEVASISLPAFVRSVREVKVNRTKHKRFTMSDIGRLEKRLEQVEYYTSLSLLEQDTANLQITDANGLNRFKSGFFVDNFKKHASHQIGHPDFSASIDPKNGHLRPGHYTTCLDLVVGSKSFIGIGTTANPTLDINYLTDIDGDNVKKTGRLLTLDYEEEEFIKQVYASRLENLNPYLIVYYSGDIKLNPDSDTWTDTKFVDANVIMETEEYDLAIEELGINAQTGLGEAQWGSWETDWIGEQVLDSFTTTSESFRGTATIQDFRNRYGSGATITGSGTHVQQVRLNTTNTFNDILQSHNQSRDGIQMKVTPVDTSEVIGEKIVSRDVIPYMRKRNIEIVTHRMKPKTQFYVYFDDIDVTSFVTPKLLEINMTSGVFQTGEDVHSHSGGSFVFRLATPNHKEGPYNEPTKVLTANPYNIAAGISTVYSTSSTLLNVDTFSLASQVQGKYQNHVLKGMKLVGETSGAEATVTDVRLITDTVGQLTCSFDVPNPNIDSNPRFETGTKTLRLTTSPVNSKLVGTVTGSAEANFAAQGILDTKQETVLTTRVPQIERLSIEDQRVVNDRITRQVSSETTVSGNAFSPRRQGRRVGRRERAQRRARRRRNSDPLAQSFQVTDSYGSGVFITSVDVFFQSKDDELPVTLEIRTIETGLPSSRILPFSMKILDPSEINISQDASIPTRFTFDSPVFLTGDNARFCIVLMSASENYNAWISRMGEVDISTVGLPDEQQVVISQQPYLGSLFKSQNGSTWDPSQFEDLKFVINKAVFNTNPGVGRFFNPQLQEGNDQIITLPENSITALPRKAVVGLGTTIPDTAGLVPGVLIGQFGNERATAKLINVAGVVTTGGPNDLNIINPGVGYTPSSGSLTYSSVPMVTQTGEGTGAVGNITVNNGVISAVTLTDGGKNFAVGDTLGIGTLGLGNGSGAVISVGLITERNSLVITNAQGKYNLGIGTVGFNNGSAFIGLDGTTGLGVTAGGNIGSGVTITTFDVDTNSDGLHFKVDHRAHGMNSFNNLVKISGVDSDLSGTKLTADYDNNSLSDIPVVATSNFAKFEGVGVGTTNYGYAIIGDEIISYTGVSDSSITGITTRGVDSSTKSSHSSGDVIKLYQFQGVSLRRINKTHDMNSPSATVTKPKDLDFYHIKVDMSKNGTDRSIDNGKFPDQFFGSEFRGGGSNVTATQNVQFETLTPSIQTSLPNGTSIGGRVRTISATSIDGSEQSFVDQGFESVSLDSMNHFETPRMVASKVNEDKQLSDLPGNKSMTFEFLLNSVDDNVSPVIDLDRVSAILTTNRLNSPVSNFASDSRVNQTGQDPCASTYVSNLIALENPATSLKVQFAGYRRDSSDIRVMYKILSEGESENSMEKDFDLFPGFDNIDQNGNIINKTNNNGKPDANVPSSIGESFKDYEFSIEDLPPFTRFQIKIDMVGTNQAQPPYIKDLRAIALA
nr:hypothetical protein [uncultured Mediterranean phage uvMED]